MVSIEWLTGFSYIHIQKEPINVRFFYFVEKNYFIVAIKEDISYF